MREARPLASWTRALRDPFPWAHGSFTSLRSAAEHHLPSVPVPSELIVSAVDVYHRGEPVLSRVVETSTSSSWFLTSLFCVDIVQCNSPPPPPVVPLSTVSPAELELRWVVIDPASGRAVNVSSRRPVAVDRHWYTGGMLVRYAFVLAGCKLEATVTCSQSHDSTVHVREISLTVEDADGAAVSGEGALRLLAGAMAGPRNRKGAAAGVEQEEAAKRRYEEFVRSKRARKESMARKEVLVDLCCSDVSAVAVLSSIATVVLR